MSLTKLRRQFLEWEWHDSPSVTSVFVHLLFMASPEESSFRGSAVHRGQVAISVRALSVATGLSEKCVRDCLMKLESTGEITHKGASKFTMVTICNYDSYGINLDSKGEQDTEDCSEICTDVYTEHSTDVCTDVRGEQKELSQYLGVTESKGEDSDEEPATASRVRSDNILNNNIINNITPTREIKENRDINIPNKRKEREAPSFDGEAEILTPLNCDKNPEKQPPRCETLVAERGVRVDYGKIVEMYHATCKSFPRIRGLTEQRKAKVKQRLAEMDGNLDTLAEVFRKMEASDFMKSGSWASFDWVFANSQNWMKILEGNYDNARQNNNQNGKFNSRFDAEFNLRTGSCGVDKTDYPDSF